jgi:hypothetical protein
MEVFHPNDTFHFDKLQLTHPTHITGGSYMTRYSYFDSSQPLYIQTTKSRSKQGIVLSGKKAYIDLLFTGTDSDAEFIEWIARLETRSVELLYEKRHLWFTQELDRTDIENSFTSPIRAYKTDNFLVRVNLEPNRVLTHIQPFSCKVFDENKKPVPVEHIKDEHTIISIIEFQGIKFTQRNFQMELLLRQVLVIPDVPLFETCVISEPNKIQQNSLLQPPPAIDNKESEEGLTLAIREEETVVEHLGTELEGTPLEQEQPLEQEIKHFGIKEVELDFDNIPDTIDTNEPKFQMEPTVENSRNRNNATTVASIKLKRHKDVLYEMYKVAKKKAVEAKKTAIRTYLEAKEIKAAYLLDNSDLSESSSDEN